MGDLQRHERNRPAAVEHDRGGLRVGPDVELRGGGEVPLPDRATHDADLGDPREQLRVRPHEARDVRQRPGRDERDAVRRSADQPRQQLHGALGHGPDSRFRQVRAVEAGRAMDVIGDVAGPHERARRPGRHRDVGPAEERQDAKRVTGGVLHARLAGHGRDPQDPELGACEREEDGQGIVVAGVAVEDHGPREHSRRVRGGAAQRAVPAPAHHFRPSCARVAHDRRAGTPWRPYSSTRQMTRCHASCPATGRSVRCVTQPARPRRAIAPTAPRSRFSSRKEEFMITRTSRLGLLVATLAIVASACSGSATPTPAASAAVPSVEPSMAASAAPSVAASPSPA